MTDKFKHLALPFTRTDVPLKKYKTKGGGYKKKEGRNKSEFFQVKSESFGAIKERSKELEEDFSEYFDPNLIFKLEINQNVTEKRFREVLKGMDFRVLSPSPDKKGYWIIFAKDKEMQKFQRKFREYAKETYKHDFFEAIDDFFEIPPEEKIGESLKSKPLGNDEIAPLDIEIWRMQDKNLDEFLGGLKGFIASNEGKVQDEFIDKNTCVIRASISKNILENLTQLREICVIDRPFSIRIVPPEENKSGAFHPEGSLKKNTCGILVIDSGILPNHPLLNQSVGEAIAIATENSAKITEDNPFDDVGHGTMVAGNALFGNIENCISNNSFQREIWIFSSKVMYRGEEGDSEFDENELFENQLERAISRIVKNYPNCKIINISMGNSFSWLETQKRQLRLASRLDELIKKYDIISVVSAGNNNIYRGELYPSYFIDGMAEDVRIIDPASSALSITVGSLANVEFGILNSPYPFPSHNTRIGPGLGGMIKPELVEIGGGRYQGQRPAVLINPDFLTGDLFTSGIGTSFSAPIVAHCIAKIINKYPNYSKNLVKALLLDSTRLFSHENIEDISKKPALFSKITPKDTNSELRKIFNVYGYGKPSLERALYSERNRVVLLRQNQIRLQEVHIYEIDVPSKFFTSGSERRISVTLVYDPPINRNRIDYLGVGMEFHLFKNTAQDTIQKKYSDILVDESADTPEDLKDFEIQLIPGVNIRKKSVHQKGIYISKGRPTFDENYPLVLAVICKNKWISPKDQARFTQDYAIVVSLQNRGLLDLYSEIETRIRTRISLRPRT